MLLKIFSAVCVFGFFHYPMLIKATSNMEKQDTSRPASTASTYWLSQEEKTILSVSAEKGDKDAAFRLAQYYSFVEFDSSKEQYWLERSASAGHAIAQYNLSFLLLNKEPPETSAALHWAEMAKQNGEEKAQMLIDEIRAATK